VLENSEPFKKVLGFATLIAEDGRPMHKSLRNAIEFNEGAESIGVDVMRWMYARQNPSENLMFGYKIADETRRRFHLKLWNVYNFFVTYANLDNFTPPGSPSPRLGEGSGVRYSVLDKWISARLHQTISIVTKSLDKYDAYTASHAIEDFVSDLSLWYVRRSRDRVGPSAADSQDKLVCLSTLHLILGTLSKLLAPFNPFVSEEIYKNLTGKESVHLSNWPKAGKADIQLIKQMKLVRKIVELGLAQRKLVQIRVRQPLRLMIVKSPSTNPGPQLEKLIQDELNVKKIVWENSAELSVTLDTAIDDELKAEGEMRELSRQVQELRKSLNIDQTKFISLISPSIPKNSLLEEFKRRTLTSQIKPGQELKIELI